MIRGQPEFRIQCSVADQLRFRAKPDVYWTALPFGEHRSERTGARLKRMGTRPGAADILVLAPGLPAIMLELKAEKGRLSPEQRATQRDWEAAGGKYFVAYGFRMAIEFLEGLGIVRPDRSVIRPNEQEAA